ncbi:MAG: alkaline phosphatase family protein [Deltaproteobacteria bacterium]|nr:alkaline phosphatase family protein [Deltaproteobacteria bacterium]
MTRISPRVLFLGIDAMMPEVVFDNLHRFANIRRLCATGASCSYDAYTYGYGSRDNWLSIYTGLTPKQHGCKNNIMTATGKVPTSRDYAQSRPFWTVLNDFQTSVGMWRGIITSPPADVDGYMLCAEPKTLPGMNRPTHISLNTTPAKREILTLIEGELRRPPLPETLAQFGLDWETFKDNVQKYEYIISDDFFEEGVTYFKQETEYFTENMIRMQKAHPQDVLFYYTSIMDLVQHFQVHEQSLERIKRCVDAVDAAIGRFIDEIAPDNIILLSDHGTESFGSLFPGMPVEVQREAFGMRDKAVWLSDGNIAVHAANGSFLMGAHALKGFCLIHGKSVRQTQIQHMRTVDFYPTFLELLGIPVPEGREGFVLDIFEKPLINVSRLIHVPPFEEIAIIQTNEVAREGDTINAVFLENRFAHITVFGQEKYRNAFLKNGRVSRFEPVIDAVVPMEKLLAFDKVMVGNPNPFDAEHPYVEIDLK